VRWCKRILRRDKVCEDCGLPATEAHHIYPKVKWPELRLRDYNGIGLCRSCHRAIYGEEDKHIERFLKARPEQARQLGRVLPSIMRSRGVRLGLELRR
jgi:5-methylcytosine-specific restriction endonuclease McrA